MGFTNKYFSNGANFGRIAEALRTASSLPEKIDESILEELGFTNHSDTLVLNFFKELNFLTEDNTPTFLFEKFRDSDQSKEAFSLGVLEAYGDLFEEDPTIHLQSEENITKLFESKLGDKSNIIIGYMVNTFKVLVDYAGAENIDAVLETGYAEVSDCEISMDITATATIAKDAMSNHGGMSNGNGTAAIVEKDTQEASNNAFGINQTVEDTADTDSVVDTNAAEIDFINKAYIKKATLLYKLDRYEDAMPALAQVYQRFSDSDNAELYAHASDALIKHMNSAEKLAKDDTLMPIYSEVIARFKDSETEKFIQCTDHAYINIAETLLANNQNEKALEMIDQTIERLRNAQRNQDFLAKAMFKKTELLELLGSDQEALEAVEDFLNTFG